MSEEKKVTDKMELSAKELDAVSGGYVEDLADYVNLLNRYGYTKQAERLKKSGVMGFSHALQSILGELGFPEKVEFYVREDGGNLIYMNGRGVGNFDLLSRMEDYFVHGENYYGMY